MDVNFSQLATEFMGETHPLYAARDRILADGDEIIDLVRGNVTEHGILYPQDVLREILSECAEASGVYRPDPFGQLAAREAIEGYYGAKSVSAEHILLTPGTSISYWYCLKLLAESGDEILVPTPSYPLLDYIARLSGVTLKGYRLDESRDWAIDFDHLARQITRRTRALVLISPHNPTGMVCSQEEIRALAEIAAKHNLPIIADEVFGEFVFDQDKLPRAADTGAPLVLTLNGLSKSFALPGLKLGWIAVSGDEPLVRRSLSVLETISDTFLPVSEPVQQAVAKIIARGKEFQAGYRRAVAELREVAIAALRGARYVSPRGGFYITLPVRGDEDEVALSLLTRQRILVHPGHFYEVEGDHLVATFIQEPGMLARCMGQIRDYAALSDLSRG